MSWKIALAACVAIVFLVRQYSRDSKRQRSLRGGLFRDCMDLFPACKVIQDGLQFPVLTGRYKGFNIKLEPILDDMTIRKLPSLWLKVSLYAPVRFSGVFDLLVRPRGNEFYSPAFELPVEIKPPAGWPTDSMIRSDDPCCMPPEDALAKHMNLFDDLKMKELLITPRGVRLVYQCDQAERALYSVLRQCSFASSRLAPDLARRLLEAAISVYGSVAPEPTNVFVPEQKAVSEEESQRADLEQQVLVT
ncbi:MAG: hypothetical protein EPN75_05830 [Beijerinckiaceae bacterium]|nr:MAG: hypothetical protein EPN75_05830 [Beijerinckiaceae bacterium]